MPEQQSSRGNQITQAPFETIYTRRGAVAYVSPEDADLAKKSWYLNTNGYFMRYTGGGRANRKQETLHREIMLRLGPSPVGQYVDHIDGDKRNNRRENLRWVTTKQSNWNKPAQGSNATYKGVYRLPQYPNKFTASIRGKYLGIFNSAEAAARAYDEAAYQLGGAYARLNFPRELIHA